MTSMSGYVLWCHERKIGLITLDVYVETDHRVVRQRIVGVEVVTSYYF